MPRSTSKPNAKDVIRAIKSGMYDLIELDELHAAARAAYLAAVKPKLKSTQYPPNDADLARESLTIGGIRSIIKGTIEGL